MRSAEVLAERLANQRLTGPLAGDPVQVVRELLAIQAQDAPTARAMIALRCGADEDAVLQAVAAGQLVRTHVLRPTWHYVAAEDLRWLLAATSAKVESGMGSRHRQLSLSPDLIAAGLTVITERLAGRDYATRPALGEALLAAAVVATDALFGQRVGHLILIAELRALICSAPLAAAEHHYARLDEVIAAADVRPREELIAELVARFGAGHGPVALSDLNRWAGITLSEARAALPTTGLEMVVIDGEQLWRSPASRPATRARDALLLSTFDEAFLSYRKVGWPRSAGHPLGDAPYTFAQAAGGVALWRLTDVGSWRRVRRSGESIIELTLDPGLPKVAHRQFHQAADELLAVLR